MLKLTIKLNPNNLKENASAWAIKNLAMISHQLQAVRLAVN